MLEQWIKFRKLDILGLKTISIIQKAIDNIESINSFEELCAKINMNDSAVFKDIASGKSDCIFQISSDMMKGLVKQIMPTEFNDIVAITSIGRPGPLSAGFDKLYAEGKNNGEIRYPIRGCEDILDVTYGVPVYQEQLNVLAA